MQPYLPGFNGTVIAQSADGSNRVLVLEFGGNDLTWAGVSIDAVRSRTPLRTRTASGCCVSTTIPSRTGK